jgi:hypothetical protein
VCPPPPGLGPRAGPPKTKTFGRQRSPGAPCCPMKRLRPRLLWHRHTVRPYIHVLLYICRSTQRVSRKTRGHTHVYFSPSRPPGRPAGMRPAPCPSPASLCALIVPIKGRKRANELDFFCWICKKGAYGLTTRRSTTHDDGARGGANGEPYDGAKGCWEWWCSPC